MLIETQIPPVPGISDHGLMSGLGDDDHTQYLLVDGSRIVEELTIGGSGQLYIYPSGSDVRFYCDSGDIYLDVTSCLYVSGDIQLSGDLDILGTQINIAYGGMRIRSNDSNYDAEYDNWDSSNHIFQYQGSDLFAIKSDGIHIHSSTDYASIKMVGSELQIWGGMGDIVLEPYDFTVVKKLLAPNGIEFDIYGSENISSSSGDMFYYAYYGHTFYGDELRSMGGFMSGAGNAGISQTLSLPEGVIAFEDGLMVYSSIA